MVLHQHFRNGRLMHLTYKQPHHSILSFYYSSAQQQRSALYLNLQQRSIIITYFDVALYSTTQNTFFLNVYFYSIEYVFPPSQDFVLKLVCLLVYFLSGILVTFNSLHPEQLFCVKARATWVCRKRYHSDLLCSQFPLILAHTVGSLIMWTNINNRPLSKLYFALFRSGLSLLNSIQDYFYLNISVHCLKKI